MRSVLLFAAIVLGSLPACAQAPAPDAAAAPAAVAPQPSGPRPRLVIFLSVDQLRPDYLERWRPQFTGGYRRLLDGGHFYTKAVHDHAFTETAPGHSTMMSGRFPYSTGIARNSEGVETRDVRLIGSRGTAASPFRFRGTTVTDWLVARDSSSRVLSVSRKDRGAILPIGRSKQSVFWYAQDEGTFTTSTYYADTLPTWVQAFNAEDLAVTKFGGRVWTPLLPDSEYAEPDSVPLESLGQEFTFPYVMPTDRDLAHSMIVAYPWMDELTLDFAWRGLRAMDLGGSPDRTDLLAISLSTTDAVGHRWGADSREMHDLILRTDRALGAFLDSVFALRGEENVVIALTADHGVAPTPGVASTWENGRVARRLPSGTFDAALASLVPVMQRYQLPLESVALDFPVLEIDRAMVPGKDRELREVARAFARAAQQIDGVRRVYVVADLARADTVRDVTARRWWHMFHDQGYAIAAVTLEPYTIYGTRTGTHGSPYDYDARVPVIFYGRAFAPGFDAGPARVVDIAPTLAHLLGLTPSERLDGVVLTSAFKPAP